MIIRNLVVAAGLLLLATNNTFAQTDFFWSLNDLNTGATNSDLVEEFSPGDSASLYLYYTTNGPANSNLDVGAFVDITVSQSGLIQFNAAETFDYNISLFGTPLAVRWGDSFGSAASVSDEEIDELGAFTFFSGEGILESNNGLTGLFDEGYDAGADGFLFGRVDFTIPSDATPGETVDVLVTAGSGGIVNQGLPVEVTFGNVSIQVATDILLGDTNGDGAVNMCDVSSFVQAIIAGVYVEVADVNVDNKVDLLDVRPFVKLIQPHP